ncbi:MAG: anthranilate phosphoribosyltransferase [Thaumarchaeota archaeon]|nr:anthranilate phosphoribosyltransferase [Nitrososphaerota archaeon]
MTGDVYKLNNQGCSKFNKTINSILNGEISDQKIALFLSKLSNHGESDEELLLVLKNLQKFAIHVPIENDNAIDVCGTGGDKKNTINVSTAAAFVIASLNGVVAKHGNRSSSGLIGSADIFEYFGYDLNKSPNQIIKMLQKYNICFMFAQKFHPALHNIHNARKMINGPTIFNIVSPISNPAGVKNQLIGVYDDKLVERLPKILKENGSTNIMTVRSEDGLDEISTTSNNHICILQNGKIKSFILNTVDVGLPKTKLSDIQISSNVDALVSFISILDNTAKKSLINIIAVNAAAGLIISNLASDFREGVKMALNSIYEKKPYYLFKKFITEYGDIKKLENIENIKNEYS